jgi:hypothetical protein
MVEEKRKHSRIDSVNLLNYVYFDENQEEENQGMGRTLNVSESGILLETHNPIDTSHFVSLTIGFKEDVVEIKGKVIYKKENDEGMNRVLSSSRWKTTPALRFGATSRHLTNNRLNSPFLKEVP